MLPDSLLANPPPSAVLIGLSARGGRREGYGAQIQRETGSKYYHGLYGHTFLISHSLWISAASRFDGCGQDPSWQIFFEVGDRRGFCVIFASVKGTRTRTHRARAHTRARTHKHTQTHAHTHKHAQIRTSSLAYTHAHTRAHTHSLLVSFCVLEHRNVNVFSEGIYMHNNTTQHR